ncbi:hypothetical protein H1R20_g10132, partial [Candolleomyces eurysporus]
MSRPKAINGFQHSFRADPILEHKAHAPVDSALSTTPVANSGLAAPEHADVCPIELRKRTFAVYMRKLVTLDYDDFATWQYFDHIGIMHTGQNELKHRKLMGKAPLFVDLMHLSLLLAWTLDVLTPVILSYTEYPLSRRIEIMQAFQKVIWIQNDLFSRHYALKRLSSARASLARHIRFGVWRINPSRPPTTTILSLHRRILTRISSKMSARTPFFPGGAPSRPPTHTTGSESTPNGPGGNAASSGFIPDLSNPLHAFSGSGQKTAASGKANGAGSNMLGMGDASAVHDTGNANGNALAVPKLNLSGLKKKKGPLVAPVNNNSGLTAGGGGFNAAANGVSMEGNADGFGISRPATADPYAKTNAARHGLMPRASLGSNHNPGSGATAASGRQGAGGGPNKPFGVSKSGPGPRREVLQPPQVSAPVPLSAAGPPPPLFNTNANVIGANHAAGTLNSNLDSSGSVPSFSGFKTLGGALTGQGGANMDQNRDWAGLALERPHTSMGNDQNRNVNEVGQQSNQQQDFRTPAFNLGFARTPDTSAETLVNQDDDSFDHSRGSKLVLDGFHRGFEQLFPGMDPGATIAGGGGGGGHRRVTPDKEHLNHRDSGGQYADRRQHGVMLPGRGTNEQGRVFQQAPASGREGRKRLRDQVDLEQGGMEYDMPDAHRMKMAKTVDEVQEMGHRKEEYDVPSQRPTEKVLMVDTDEFFANHMDLYDQAVRRWSNCSIDEWFSGAEVVSSKLTECLNLVSSFPF